MEDVYGVNVGDGLTGKHFASFGQVTDPITGVGKDDFYDVDYAGFAEDSWKVRPNLTVNLGVRYEIQTIPQPPKPNTSTSLNTEYTSKINTDSNNFAPPHRHRLRACQRNGGSRRLRHVLREDH